MASRKQLEANRQNATRSTGPKTQEGKARSRLNSRKHGLTAKMLVIGGEDPAQFEELRAELMEQHDPQSVLECELVERLSGILWRLRRVPFFEAAILEAHKAELEEFAMNETSVGEALIRDGSHGDGLGKLARHETTLMNAFTKTLQMLLLLQGNRQGEKGSLIVETVALPPKDR